MDPISAINLAGSIVQFIEFGGEVTKRLHEFNSNGKDVPEGFREVKIGLPLLLVSIEQIQEDLNAGKPINPNVADALLPVIEDCTEQVRRLDKILVEALPAPDDSQWKDINKALSSFWQDKKVNEIVTTIDRYQGHLLLHQSSPTSSDAGLERQRGSISDAIGQSEPAGKLHGFGDTAVLPTRTRDQGTSYSPPFTRIPTVSSVGTPIETVFDSRSSIRTTSTARTDLSIPSPTAPQPKVWRAVDETTEEPGLFMPEPALDRPQRTIEATMTYFDKGSRCGFTSKLEFGRSNDGNGTVTSIFWTGISDDLWICHSLSQSESQYPHTEHPEGDDPTTQIVSFMGKQVLLEQEQFAEPESASEPRGGLPTWKRPPDPKTIVTEKTGIEYSFTSPEDLEFFRQIVFGKSLLCCIPVNKIALSKTKIECETQSLSLWESSGVRTIVYFANARSMKHVELEVASSDALRDFEKSDACLTLKVKSLADFRTQRSNSVGSIASAWSVSPTSKDKDCKGLKVTFGSVTVRDQFAHIIRHWRPSLT